MESGNDYVIQVKGNQAELHKAIQVIIDTEEAEDTFCTSETKRGRTENREISIYDVDREVAPFSNWVELQKIIHFKSYGTRKDKEYYKDHYYIGSLKTTNAKYLAQGIRSHWGIENRLHWVKDVVLNEDKSRIKTGSIARNLSLIKGAIINLYRLNGYDSITKAIEKYANRLSQSLILLENNHIEKIRSV